MTDDELNYKREGRSFLQKTLAAVLLFAGLGSLAIGADHMYHDHRNDHGIEAAATIKEQVKTPPSDIQVRASESDLDPGIDSLEVPVYIRDIEQMMMIKFKKEGNTVTIFGGKIIDPKGSKKKP